MRNVKVLPTSFRLTRLRYFEDGSRRLQHERDTDPTEHERHRQNRRAMLERVEGH